MSAEEKDRSASLSRIAADLFVKSKDSGDLSSKIRRLRDEIKKVIESKETIFGKFRELEESFREIIPEEKQRYHAAIKALSTTSGLNRQEIARAVNQQLEELRILEKGFLHAGPNWRDELKSTEAKSLEMRDEIAKLREKIVRLEAEEKEIMSSTVARKKEMEVIEKAVGELFADIGAEITSIKNKVDEFTAASQASQSVRSTDAAKSDQLSAGTGGSSEIFPEPSAPQNSEWQKKCPMCGGRMDFYMQDGMWRCYSCAYEEPVKDGVPGRSEEEGKEEKKERAKAFETVSVADSIFDNVPSASKSSPTKPSSKKKTCPACGKKMNWYEEERVWRCTSCEYERGLE
jgi:ribosomal protein L37AE/L43A/phage shock protein A